MLNNKNNFWKMLSLFTTLVFLLCGFLLGQSAMAQDRTDKLIAGAKNEGKLVWYASLNLQDCTAVLRQFEKKYPFIKTALFRLNAERLLEKIFAEDRAKFYKVDAIMNGGFRQQVTKEAGLLTKYFSPERKAFPEGFKDPEGYWTDTFVNANVLAYNTRMVAPGDIPKSHEDLLDPKWKGKIAMSLKSYEWFMQMLNIMGEEKGLDFMKKLSKQKPAFRSSATTLRDMVIAGEYHMTINTYLGRVQIFKEMGAPIEWVPLNPVIGILHPIGVATHAPHPNAAKLFIDFVLSKEGMELISSFRRIVTRSDVDTDPPNLTKGIKIYPSDPRRAKDYNKYMKMFQNIFLK
ncbi:ABC transporter substrate-binding protein [Thermodesulfobacteriota bacterium]